jgi:hypothetical protein
VGAVAGPFVGHGEFHEELVEAGVGEQDVLPEDGVDIGVAEFVGAQPGAVDDQRSRVRGFLK